MPWIVTELFWTLHTTVGRHILFGCMTQSAPCPEPCSSQCVSSRMRATSQTRRTWVGSLLRCVHRRTFLCVGLKDAILCIPIMCNICSIFYAKLEYVYSDSAGYQLVAIAGLFPSRCNFMMGVFVRWISSRCNRQGSCRLPCSSCSSQYVAAVTLYHITESGTSSAVCRWYLVPADIPLTSLVL